MARLPIEQADVETPVPERFRMRLRQRTGRLFTRSGWDQLVELTRAEYRAGEYNSVLGLAWSLLGPGAMLGVMYVVFRSRFGSDIQPYPLYLLLGIVLVNFFVLATRQLAGILFSSAPLLLNCTVPRETLILSKLAVHLLKFLVEILVCAGLSVFYGLFSWSTLLLVVPLLMGYISLVLGTGLVLALAYAFARDVDHIWGMAARLLLFASPVFYQLDSVSPAPRALLYWLNPLTPFLQSFRFAFMGGADGSWGTLCHSLGLGAVVLALGYSAFLLLENSAVERA